MFVSVVMGSMSDWDVVQPAVELLKAFDVDVDVKVLSAHRTPHELVDYINGVSDKVEVFIAAAGLSAALPGVIAAHTVKPVIGLPIKSGAFQGMDSLLSMAQMPPGVPVATVGVGIAKNAALLALEILAIKYPEVREKLIAYREEQRQKVLQAEVK